MTKHIIRLGVFFDGTGNEGFNAEIKQEKLKSKSYKLSPTNIYRLYNNYKFNSLNKNKQEQKLENRSYSNALYIGGIGTLPYQTDRLWDGIFGNVSKYAGADAKIRQAIYLIVEELQYYLKFYVHNTIDSIQIEFDIFGFSRGAALARMFSKQIDDSNSVLNKVLKDNVKNNIFFTISINFMGLYDTVGSFISLKKDSKLKYDLSLNDIKAKTIVQLAAMHECRINFPLTSIFSENNYTKDCSFSLGGFKGKNSNGTVLIEVIVPGSHLDIGGSYLKEHQAGFRISNKSKKEINENNIWSGLFDIYEKDRKNIFQKIIRCKSTYFKPVKIKGDLQYVYLLLMVHAANKSNFINEILPMFDVESLHKVHFISQDSEDLRGLLKSTTTAINRLYDNSLDSYMYKEINNQLMRNLFKNYIHISANPINVESKKEKAILEKQKRLLKRSNHSIAVHKPHSDWKRVIIFK